MSQKRKQMSINHTPPGIEPLAEKKERSKSRFKMYWEIDCIAKQHYRPEEIQRGEQLPGFPT